jgi:hypothetical protein
MLDSASKDGTNIHIDHPKNAIRFLSRDNVNDGTWNVLFNNDLSYKAVFKLPISSFTINSSDNHELKVSLPLPLWTIRDDFFNCQYSLSTSYQPLKKINIYMYPENLPDDDPTTIDQVKLTSLDTVKYMPFIDSETLTIMSDSYDFEQHSDDFVGTDEYIARMTPPTASELENPDVQVVEIGNGINLSNNTDPIPIQALPCKALVFGIYSLDGAFTEAMASDDEYNNSFLHISVEGIVDVNAQRLYNDN